VSKPKKNNKLGKEKEIQSVEVYIAQIKTKIGNIIKTAEWIKVYCIDTEGYLNSS
jgi:hypothetical protein